MAGRIPRLSPGFRRAMVRLNIASSTTRRRAVAATVRALAADDLLPASQDTVVEFRPGRAYVRRVPGHNLWVWYRFDSTTVSIVSVSDQPPVPSDDQ